MGIGERDQDQDHDHDHDCSDGQDKELKGMEWWVQVVGAALRRDWGEAVSWDRGVKPLLCLKADKYVCAPLCVVLPGVKVRTLGERVAGTASQLESRAIPGVLWYALLR